MSFLESQAKAGYYPTPEDLLPSIATFVKPRPEPCPEQSRRAVEGPGKGGRLLDPCCGEGTAAAHLAKAWNLKAVNLFVSC